MAWLNQARVLCVSVVVLSLIGCTALRPYKMDIHQGNILEPEKVEKLQVGMTHGQVLRLLGTPMLENSFENDRWDYIYYTKPGYGEANEEHIRINFKDGKVSEIKQDQPIKAKDKP
jgi:outer membrane protein assembly factor BamE